MNKLLILFGLILLSTITFASNPSIISIDSNNFYLNKEGQIVLTIDSADTNGKIEFYDNSSLISLTSYNNTDSQFIFNRTYANTGDRNILFKLVDINGENTNTSDDNKSKIISVKTGVDLAVVDINFSQSPIQPSSTVNIIVKTKNIGDQNFKGTVQLQLYIDGNMVSSQPLMDLNVDEEKTFSFNWTTKSDFNSAIIRAYILSSGIIYDPNILNNEKVVIVGSTSLADLSVKNVVTRENFRRDFLETITVIVTNSGGRSLDNINVEVWKDKQDEEHKIYSNTFSISGNSEKSLDFIYSFPEVKETTLIVILNRDNKGLESDYSNNSYTKKVNIFDFNLNSILADNDSLRQQLSTATAKYNSTDIERQSCMNSLATLRTENESCSSNLNICNTNNNTKIANYMAQMDSNRNAEKTIYLNEVARIGQEKQNLVIQYENQIKSLKDEKGQWSLLVIGMIVGLIIFIVYGEYVKRNPRKAIGIKEVEQ